MTCIICFMNGHDAMSFTITGVMNSNPTAIQAEDPIHLIHLIHSTLLPAPPSLLRLHSVISMHHQDAGADECQQYTQAHPRSSTRAPLLQEITIMCCSRFHSTLSSVFLFGFVSNVSVEREVYCLVLDHIMYFFLG